MPSTVYQKASFVFSFVMHLIAHSLNAHCMQSKFKHILGFKISDWRDTLYMQFNLFCFVATLKTWHGGTVAHLCLKQIYSLMELARSIFKFGSILSPMNLSHGGITIRSFLFIIKYKYYCHFLLYLVKKVLTEKIKYSLTQFGFYVQCKADFIWWRFTGIWDFCSEVENKWWNFLSHFLGHVLNKKVIASCYCCLPSICFSYINAFFYFYHL